MVNMAAITQDKGVMLGVTLGVAVGILVILAAILAVVLRRCTGKESRRSSESSRESAPTVTSYSAPSTRSSSPHNKKRCSSGSSGSIFDRTTLQRSVTMDTIPDFRLPAERIQTYSSEDDPQMDSMLQFQYNLLGHLQPDRYSLSSLEDENVEEPQRTSGQIFFSLLYDAASEKLTVSIIRAKDIMGRGRTNSPRDPFVKMFLLPDEKTSHQTRVAKKTLSPVFNETFQFSVKLSDINNRTLRMSVYDVDKRRIRHSLGHVFVPLSEVELTQNEIMSRDLEETSQTAAGLGEISFSLTYNPTAEKLKVVILRAKDIRQTEFDNGENCYVKVQLLHGQSIHKARKSSPQKGTTDPSFNESFGFTIPCRQLDSCSIRITVMMSQHGLMTSHDREYGRVTVGSYLYARGEQNAHWQEMISHSRTPITKWHCLESPHSRRVSLMK